MCTATIGHELGADHWPIWSGAPVATVPPIQAETGPLAAVAPDDHVDGSVNRFVCALTSAALPPPPCVRKRSAGLPAGPSSATQ